MAGTSKHDVDNASRLADLLNDVTQNIATHNLAHLVGIIDNRVKVLSCMHQAHAAMTVSPNNPSRGAVWPIHELRLLIFENSLAATKTFCDTSQPSPFKSAKRIS